VGERARGADQALGRRARPDAHQHPLAARRGGVGPWLAGRPCSVTDGLGGGPPRLVPKRWGDRRSDRRGGRRGGPRVAVGSRRGHGARLLPWRACVPRTSPRSTMKHYLLFYDLAADYLERRAEFRD